MVAGAFKGSIEFATGTATHAEISTGGQDFFVARYSGDGVLQWVTTPNFTEADLDDIASGVALDSADNAYVVGTFRGTVDFDGGTIELVSTGNPSGGNDTNHFLMKLDPGGTILWATTSDTSSLTETGSAVAVANDGSVYVAGDFTGTVDFEPGAGTTSLVSTGQFDQQNHFIAKYDANGTFQWARTAQDSSGFESATAVAADQAGNVYVAGWFDGTLTLDADNVLIANGDFVYNYFIAKYDDEGNLEWARTTGESTSSEYASALSIDALGNVYVSGSFDGTVDFDSTAADATIYAPDDFGLLDNHFTAKYSADGDFRWVTTSQVPGISEFGSNESVRATDIYQGKLYSTGGFVGTVDFDPGDGEAVVDSGEDESKHFLTIQTLPYPPLLPEWPDAPPADTTPPDAPVITAFASNTGNPYDQSTTDQTLLLYGTAEAESTVTLFRNIAGQGWTAIGTTTADAAGNWAFDYTGTTLAHTDHAFQALATDEAGNASPRSNDYVVTIKYVEGVDGFGGPGSIIYGHGFGNDDVVGSSNADSIRGGAGDDTMLGMDGSDRLFGDNGNDVINGNRGDDEVHGGNGDDIVMGGRGNDWVFGDDGNDWLNGNLGNDVVEGGAGNDTLHGGQGMDQLLGGAGNDVLAGDLGNDTLTGGAGSDQFYFGPGSGQDRVTDFTVGADQVSIDLTGGMINGVAIASIADLLARIADTADGAYLDLGDGHGVLLAGVAKAQLSADQFLLV